MKTKARPNYLRTVSLGVLLGLIISSTLTNPSDLYLLMQGAEQAAVVVAWIGGLR